MKQLIYTFISFLIILSCQKEIDFTGQTPPIQMYANCILNPDSALRVFVSYTVPISASISEIDNKLEEAKQALVLIKNPNNTVFDTLQLVQSYTDDLRFLVFESPTLKRPLLNIEYQLEVSEPLFPNRKKIVAKHIIPKPIAPIFADTASPARIVTGNNTTFKIRINWADPSSTQNNFYIIEMIYKKVDLLTNEIELVRSELYPLQFNDNQDIGDQNDKFLYIFANDMLIPPPLQQTNLSTEVAVLCNTFDNWRASLGQNFSCELLVRVHHTTNQLYQYYKEVEKYRSNSSNDIFAQPVAVHNNALEGLGFLGGEIIREHSIRLQ